MALDRYRIKWYLLALSSGCVNAGGFLACARFVSHITGFATLTGIELAQGKFDAALGIMTVPVFFLMGVMISAYLVDRCLFLGKAPHYKLVLFLVCFCLTTAAIGGELHWFGEFGDPLKLKHGYVFLALLCMASGLQNAAITTRSGATVRTTHLTGLTTDLGIGLIKTWATPGIPKSAKVLEIQANQVRLSTIAAYGLGSVIGAFCFLQIHYLGFLVPALLTFYVLIASWVLEKRSQYD